MAMQIRKTTDAMVFAIVTAFNLCWRWFVTNKTTYPHADITSTTGGNYTAPTTTALTVAAANATNLATGITLAEAVRSWMLVHLNDGGASTNGYGGAHKAADTTNYALITYTASAKLTSSSSQGNLNTLLNLLKSTANAHVSQSGVHFTNDGTNTVSASDATDLASSETLANALKTWCNAHGAFAPDTAQTVQLIAA